MLDVPVPLRDIATDLQHRLRRIEATPHPNLAQHQIQLDGEALRFPCRLYADGTRLMRLASSLQGDARLLCLCLATRHPDGHLRQHALETLGAASAPWVLAFHLALLGEYVEEIAVAVEQQAQQIGLAAYLPLVRANPAFVDRCIQRAASYWNAYYRSRHPTLRTFPAHRLLLQLRSASRSP